MNERHQIESALERRFARVNVPKTPRLAWSACSSTSIRRTGRHGGLAYACAALVVLISGGIAAQASGALSAGYAHLFNSGSVERLPPMIHRSDRLTVPQAQQRVPFSIVVPVGLPPDTTFDYATIANQGTSPDVALAYQTKLKGRYYRIIIVETTALSGPRVAHFNVEGIGKDGRTYRKTWTLPLRVWKHGAIFMEMLPQGLPPAVVDRIVRENTL